MKSNFLTQDVIGSLPKGLTRTEKEAVAASTPLSPSLNLLNSLPKGQVFKRSAAGVALRRSVLRGSVIVFITAGYTGAGQGAGVSRNSEWTAASLFFTPVRGAQAEVLCRVLVPLACLSQGPNCETCWLLAGRAIHTSL